MQPIKELKWKGLVDKQKIVRSLYIGQMWGLVGGRGTEFTEFQKRRQ